MELAAAIAQQLLQIKAIKLSPQKPFTWASGLQSPIYCDNRIVLSHPEVRNQIIDGFIAKAKEQAEFDVVAGVATAGIPHGALLADRLNKPFIYVRSKAKAHGRQNMIEGEVQKGARVLVIEDLISTGGSSLKAVEALREAGCEVTAVLAIFTYAFPKAAEAFQQANCPLDTISSYPVLLEEAVRQEYLAADELQTLQDWRQDPQAWSTARS